MAQQRVGKGYETRFVSAWVRQRNEKKMKILSHLSSCPDKSADYQTLRGVCQSELLCDFIIFREAVLELVNEGKVKTVGDLVTLNFEKKNTGGL